MAHLFAWGSEDAGEPTGQEPGDTTPQVGGTGDDGGREQEEGQGPRSYDEEYVRRIRREAAQYRTRLQQLEATLRERENAEKSEAEKLRDRVSELEAETLRLTEALKTGELRMVAFREASKLGFLDPDDAWRLIDLADVEFDEAGTPVNIDKLLKSILSRKPYLGGRVGSGTSPTNPPAGRSSADQLTAEDLKKMTPEQVAAIPLEQLERIMSNR